MTPMVQAAIALLALSKLEVAALLRDRLATNPWLMEQPQLPFPLSVPIMCEIVVTKGSSGYAVCLHDSGLPTVKVRALSEQGRRSKAARRLHNEATWLIRGLARRQEILLAVAEAVVQLQTDFFAQGRTFLKPLTLRQVAEQVKLHPSTVSRVTANKTLFIQHSHGGDVLELRTLFTTRPRMEALEQAVAALIEGEPATGEEPLSDERIATLLESQGYQIARRTVAKHRASLGIGHAYHRRRQ